MIYIQQFGNSFLVFLFLLLIYLLISPVLTKISPVVPQDFESYYPTASGWIVSQFVLRVETRTRAFQHQRN